MEAFSVSLAGLDGREIRASVSKDSLGRDLLQRVAHLQAKRNGSKDILVFLVISTAIGLDL